MVTLAACSPLTLKLKPSALLAPLAVGKRPRMKSRMRAAMAFTTSSFTPATNVSTAASLAGSGSPLDSAAVLAVRDDVADAGRDGGRVVRPAGDRSVAPVG